MATTLESLPKAENRYRVPNLLQDIHLLDLLELCGTTVEASRFLSLSQPTVSRRYRSLASDFNLERLRRQGGDCCYGSSRTMRLLRLGCRAHRLAAGVARIGADLLHQPLLAGVDWILPSPPRFRSPQTWLALVRQGVLDGALISGLELEGAQGVEAPDLAMQRLGDVSVLLAGNGLLEGNLGPSGPAVLVPHRGVAPGLHRALAINGYRLKSVGETCVTAQHWLQRLERAGGAIPISRAHGLAKDWTRGLERLELAAPLSTPVWLVLPRQDEASALLDQLIERLLAHPALERGGGI